MTTRHRKATRPLTPLSSIAPATRRGLAVAASSGLAMTMIAAGANAANGTEVADSAGSLGDSMITAEVRAAVTTNAPISVDATAEDVTSDAAVDVETADEAAARVAAEQAQAAAEAAAAQASNAAATGTTAGTAAPVVAAANASGSSIVAIAMQYQGVPYVSGGTSPSGWDCSGFVQFVYAQAGIALPRTSYAQGSAGTLVSAAEAQPGDIVYYGYHVGIYAGDGMMIDAGTPATGTVYRPIWGSPTGFVRVG